MEDLKKYDFDLDKIKEHADELPVVERVKYLKKVITAYKESAGMVKEDGATETRMTTLAHKGKLIQYLEKLIEKNRKQLMKIENKFDRAHLQFEEGLQNIDLATTIIKELPDRVDYFITMLKDRVRHLEGGH